MKKAGNEHTFSQRVWVIEKLGTIWSQWMLNLRVCTCAEVDHEGPWASQAMRISELSGEEAMGQQELYGRGEI